MSARSMVRARAREVERSQRRGGRRIRQISVGAAAALGAGIAMAPSAQAATFTVNSNADGPVSACDATCTLRDATEAANLDATADTVTFAASVTGEIAIDNVEGYIPLYSAMTISGPGADVLTIDGGDTDQIFYVAPDIGGDVGDPVTISGLTLSNGSDSGNGGAIGSRDANLTLAADVFRRNYSGNDGGAVFAQGGSLTIADSTFSGNSSDDDGGAFFAYSELTGVTIRGSSFSANTAAAYGGAFYTGGDSVSIANSTIAGNSAVEGAGGIGFSTVTGGTRIEDSTISGNVAGDYGGGIYTYNYYDQPIAILNSTISGNSAGDGGGGIFRYGFDSAMTPGTEETFTLSSAIVAGNFAERGPDLVERIVEPGDEPIDGSFALSSSLIGDTAGGATITQSGPNLLNVDPQLGLLANNGGPTQTILPATTSPAIDAGIANGLATDQRGLPRTVKTTFTPAPGSDGTDIGAVELADAALDGATVKVKKKQAQKGKKVVITVEVGATEDVQAAASGKVKSAKKNVKLKKVTKIVAGGTTAKLKLKPKNKKATKTILKVLDDGKKAKASLTVTLNDPAGNATTKKPKVTLKG